MDERGIQIELVTEDNDTSYPAGLGLRAFRQESGSTRHWSGLYEGKPIRSRDRKDLFVPNHHLPTKPCAHCRREFAWRKKWERDWERVKYCSKKCQAATKGGTRQKIQAAY